MTTDRTAEPDAATPSEASAVAPDPSAGGDGAATESTAHEAAAGEVAAKTASAPPPAAASSAAETPEPAPEPTEAPPAKSDVAPSGPPAPPPEPVEDPRIAELSKEAETLRTQRGDLAEKLLRTAADFDNYRKRSRRELEEAKARGRDETIRELLPVFDNLERAVAASGSTQESSAVLEGVRMVLKLFEDTAQRMGLTRVPAVGARFDPAVHEALQQRETNEAPPGTVITEVTPGYSFGKRLLRAALVIVAREPTAPKVTPTSETIRAEPLPSGPPEGEREPEVPVEAPAAAAASEPEAAAPTEPRDAGAETHAPGSPEPTSVDDSTSEPDREDDAPSREGDPV